MRTSAEHKLREFLRANPEWFASAHLQRQLWSNKDGTNASPRSIVRRLEEMVEDGILEVEYRGKHAAYYRVKQEHIKPKYRYESTPTGMREVRVQ